MAEVGAPPGEQVTGGRPTEEPGRRSLVLAICCMSVFLAGIDITIVNVALPSIQHDLQASVSDLQWTVDIYTLVIACLLIPAGALADRFGRRRMLQCGLALFMIGSLLCSVAPGLGWLVAFRAVQAAGGSFINPAAISIIISVFPNPKDRARAIGVWGSVVGLGLAAGPVMGGLLTSELGWRSIFWVNVPICIVAIVLARRRVPESRAAHPRRLDLAGETLVVLLFGTITAAIIEGARTSWGSAPIVGLLAVAVAAAVALVLVETRVPEPLVDMRFFRSAPFSGATAIAVLSPAMLSGFLFLNTIYLQDVRQDSALAAGVRTAPMAIMFALSANIGSRLVAARGSRVPVLAGGVLLTVAALMLLTVGPHTPTWYLTVVYMTFGAGAGLQSAPITNTAVSGMPADQAGVAGGLVSTCRQFGAGVGVAVCGSVVVATTGRAFINASHTAWALFAVCGLVILGLGWVSTSAWARETARRTSQTLALGEHPA
jgi:EmrB/QacA subfamily drug resistance transporter